VKVGGELRPRYEYRSPNGGSANGFTSMRARADVSASLERSVRMFVQVQDVRLWGEETHTLNDLRADNQDLHQGYLEIQSGQGVLRARVGRQELALGEERLVGSVNWAQQGRSFDGVRAGASGAFGSVDAFAFVLGESAAPAAPHEAEFFGGYARLERVGGGTLDLYGLHTHVAGVATNQATLGARYAASRGGWQYRLEGAYQLGDRDSATVRAFLLGARLGRRFWRDQVEVTLWYDHLSGDGVPGDDRTEVFETLFATNHLFYGLADLFLDIPLHTAGLGLRDAAVKLAVVPRQDLRIGLDAHQFRVVRQGGLTSRRVGEEIDLTARYQYGANLVVDLGWSWVFDGPGFRELGRLSQDLQFVYLMLTARL
jgi:hypothetical protein